MKIFNIIGILYILGITTWSSFSVGKLYPGGVYAIDLPFLIFVLLLIPFLLGKCSKGLKQ
jgi:hypothetical protein